MRATKYGDLHFENKITPHRPPHVVPPRAQGTYRQSLAPFRVFSGVVVVQHTFTGRIRAVIKIIREKYQTITENSQTWRCLHTCHVDASEKV